MKIIIIIRIELIKDRLAVEFQLQADYETACRCALSCARQTVAVYSEDSAGEQLA